MKIDLPCQGFDYAAAAAEAPDRIPDAEALLSELDGLLVIEPPGVDTGVPGSGPLNLDDLAVFPDLRTLTSAVEVRWPARLARSLQTVMSNAGLELYHPIVEV